MAFKSISKYHADKNGDFFVLPNNGDYADVIFLYRNVEDVLVADVHYISSVSYKGYAHCCEAGCPACSYGERGIRLDHKIFIPLLNISANRIEFWDRSTFFEQILQKNVFAPFPNPSEAVFRVTRNGDAGARDTTYDIIPIGRNSSMPYDKICSDYGITFPEGYSRICREMTHQEMHDALYNTGSASNLSDYGYVPVARGSNAVDPSMYSSPTVPVPQYSAPPAVAPPVVDQSTPIDLPAYDASTPQVPFQMEPLPENHAPEDVDDSEDTLDNVNF